ncbi:hypothetical protein PPL_05149 [Heterostelium album PN500]|uniref:CRAL-TRIO domain-containing protein n=1 Tax=Heterostelium pallidum (strain ATCC 26659 / Pp 5 / PN500) TaxID=670386 RepID=D3B9K5_HETP5|nr:hypothetical protein PPL_05149 [Heterostelium album PN500]EFA81917.1 hypothetical protein PPL_05149 [Heterostelium album PN500]|eukprot:XP_020434034.1 hypothetical protein PPL_05149 [Heterostelium album PN500]
MGKKSPKSSSPKLQQATEGEDFNPLANLDEKKLKIFNDFKKRCEELELDEREKTIAWRREYKPHEITAEHLSFENSTGKQYVNGKTKENLPVIYQRPSRENTKTYERQIQLMVYTLERAIEHMDEKRGVEQVALMIDFSGYSMFNMPPTSVSKQCLDILLNHYPERLGFAFIIDPPMIFNVFWSFVSPFINKNTASKIVFVKGEKQRRNLLHTHFEDNVLEAEYGGKGDFVFQRNVHWKNEIIHDRKKRGLPELTIDEMDTILALQE